VSVYNASSSVTQDLYKTVFKDMPPQCEILPNGKKGKIISGYVGVYLYGAMGLGKSTDIIKLLERVCMYQEAYQGKRQIHVGVLRNSNADFLITLGKSFSYWYKAQTSKNFNYGFFIANANTRPEVIIRFPSERLKMVNGEVVAVPEVDKDGKQIDCEIVYTCYAADSKDDEQKLKGGEFTIVWANEVNTLLPEAFDMITSRVDRYPPTGATRAFWIADANPRNKGSWEYTALGVDTPVQGIKVIQYEAPLVFIRDMQGDAFFEGRKGRWEVNPKAVIHRDNYTYWFALTNKSDTFVNNNVLGNYTNVVEGVVVHKEFSFEKHVLPAPFEIAFYQTLLISCDFGLNCAAVIGVENDTGAIGIKAAFVSNSGFTVLYEQVMSYIKTYYPVHWRFKNILIIGDPRTAHKGNLVNATTSFEVFKSDFSGDFFRVPRNEAGAIVDGIDQRIESVETYFKTGKLFIDPDCKLVINALSFGYVENGTGLPDKKKSGIYADIMDCIQYMVSYRVLGGLIDPPILGKRSSYYVY
jgi:hypothetical protein